MYSVSINNYDNKENLKKEIKYYSNIGCKYIKFDSHISLFYKIDLEKLVQYCNSFGLLTCIKVENEDEIKNYSKYFDICEINYTNIKRKLVDLIKEHFDFFIINILNPDREELCNIFYSYNPNMIVIESYKNINIIKNIQNEIGKIKLCFKNNINSLFYVAKSYGIRYFERNSKFILNKDKEYEKLIQNITLLNKSL